MGQERGENYEARMRERENGGNKRKANYNNATH